MLEWKSSGDMMTGIEPTVDFPFHIWVEAEFVLSGDIDLYEGRISVETPGLESFSLRISWNGRSIEQVRGEAEIRIEWIKGIFLDLLRLKIREDLFDEYMETRIGQLSQMRIPERESMP